jgi:hypothetical protein
VVHLLLNYLPLFLYVFTLWLLSQRLSKDTGRLKKFDGVEGVIDAGGVGRLLRTSSRFLTFFCFVLVLWKTLQKKKKKAKTHF